MTESFDERRLVESHKAGDRAAFAEIAARLYPSLMAHARSRLRDQASAEDAVQECLLRAYRALARFNGEYRLRAWTHRILENVCADEGNRRRRDVQLAQRAITLMSAAGDEPADTVAALPEPAVAAAVRSLPASYQEALFLRYVRELSYREVADAAGLSEENARARVHRARVALRRVLAASVAVVAWVVALGRRGEQWVQSAAASPASTSTMLNPATTQVVAQVATIGPERVAIASKMVAVVAAVAMPVATAIAVSPPERPRPVAVHFAAPAAQLGAVASVPDGLVLPPGSGAPAPAEPSPNSEPDATTTASTTTSTTTSTTSTTEPTATATTEPEAPGRDGGADRSVSPTVGADEDEDAARRRRTPSAGPNARAPSKRHPVSVPRAVTAERGETVTPTARPLLGRGDVAAEVIAQRVEDGLTMVFGEADLTLAGTRMLAAASVTMLLGQSEPIDGLRLHATIDAHGKGLAIQLRMAGALEERTSADGITTWIFSGRYRLEGADSLGTSPEGWFTARYLVSETSGAGSFVADFGPAAANARS